MKRWKKEGREREEKGPELSCFVTLHKPHATQRVHAVAILNGLSKKDPINPTSPRKTVKRSKASSSLCKSQSSGTFLVIFLLLSLETQSLPLPCSPVPRPRLLWWRWWDCIIISPDRTPPSFSRVSLAPGQCLTYKSCSVLNWIKIRLLYTVWVSKRNKTWLSLKLSLFSLLGILKAVVVTSFMSQGSIIQVVRS